MRLNFKEIFHFFQLVKEYIRGPNYNTAPQTFRMDALLNEMQRMEQSHHMIPSHPGIFALLSSKS